MGTRAKLVPLLLGTLAIGLPLLALVAVPTPQPPRVVERIELRAPHSGEQRAHRSTHVSSAGRGGQGSRRGDRRPEVTARRGQERTGAPTSRPISTGETGAQAQRTRPDRAAAESPTLGPRGESEPPHGGSLSPRGSPVSGTPPATRKSPPEGDPPPEQPALPEVPESPDEAASTAAVDAPEEAEPSDGDPAEEPEPADGEALTP